MITFIKWLIIFFVLFALNSFGGIGLVLVSTLIAANIIKYEITVNVVRILSIVGLLNYVYVVYLDYTKIQNSANNKIEIRAQGNLKDIQNVIKHNNQQDKIALESGKNILIITWDQFLSPWGI